MNYSFRKGYALADFSFLSQASFKTKITMVDETAFHQLKNFYTQ